VITVITIPVNRRPRRLNGNIEQWVVRGKHNSRSDVEGINKWKSSHRNDVDPNGRKTIKTKRTVVQYIEVVIKSHIETSSEVAQSLYLIRYELENRGILVQFPAQTR